MPARYCITHATWFPVCLHTSGDRCVLIASTGSPDLTWRALTPQKSFTGLNPNLCQFHRLVLGSVSDTGNMKHPYAKARVEMDLRCLSHCRLDPWGQGGTAEWSWRRESQCLDLHLPMALSEVSLPEALGSRISLV